MSSLAHPHSYTQQVTLYHNSTVHAVNALYFFDIYVWVERNLNLRPDAFELLYQNKILVRPESPTTKLPNTLESVVIHLILYHNEYDTAPPLEYPHESPTSAHSGDEEVDVSNQDDKELILLQLVEIFDNMEIDTLVQVAMNVDSVQEGIDLAMATGLDDTSSPFLTNDKQNSNGGNADNPDLQTLKEMFPDLKARLLRKYLFKFRRKPNPLELIANSLIGLTLEEQNTLLHLDLAEDGTPVTYKSVVESGTRGRPSHPNSNVRFGSTVSSSMHPWFISRSMAGPDSTTNSQYVPTLTPTTPVDNSGAMNVSDTQGFTCVTDSPFSPTNSVTTPLSKSNPPATVHTNPYSVLNSNSNQRPATAKPTPPPSKPSKDHRSTSALAAENTVLPSIPSNHVESGRNDRSNQARRALRQRNYIYKYQAYESDSQNSRSVPADALDHIKTYQCRRSETSWVIDLHGITCNQARTVVPGLLQYWWDSEIHLVDRMDRVRAKRPLTFIVGMGIHSRPGMFRLGPAVRDILGKLRYRFIDDCLNRGMFHVTGI